MLLLLDCTQKQAALAVSPAAAAVAQTAPFVHALLQNLAQRSDSVAYARGLLAGASAQLQALTELHQRMEGAGPMAGGLA